MQLLLSLIVTVYSMHIMQELPRVERANLAADIVSTLRSLILSGRLQEGGRLNEVHLSERLGVSRTPLREALGRLVAESMVEQIPRRGFFVRELSVEEARDIYPLRAILDPEALAAAGLPSADRVQELRRLNLEIERSSGEPERTLDLDETWHRLLLAHCPNRVLLELIESFIVRTRRYEAAYFRATRHVEIAIGEHDRILDHLERGDLQAACLALKQNMQSAVDPILDWLAARSSGDTE